MFSPKVTVNIIGGGKVGRTLGHLLLNRTSGVSINQVYCRNQENAKEAAEFIGGGTPISDLEYLTGADINFITTRDNAIRITADRIAENKNMDFEGSYYVHCSGALKADEVLNSLRARGGRIASCHPAISFSSPSHIIENIDDAYCGIEGDENAVRMMRKYFTEIGFKPFSLSASNKDLYHAACVSSNNFVYALAHLSNRMFKEAQIPELYSAELTTSIMKNALVNMGALDFKDVLSGPIARADIETISKHKDSIQTLGNKNIEDIFREVGRYCLLNLTDHSPEVMREICKAIG